MPQNIDKLREKASPNVKRIPSLQNRAGDHGFTGAGTSDNSNTQFATLAVWVAGRHDVPLERTLAMLVKRFRTSQDKQGTWGYNYRSPGRPTASPAMTAAGLLGLGAGHGMTPQSPGQNQAGIQDAAIRDGFKALSQHIGKSLGGRALYGRRPRFEVSNLYFSGPFEPRRRDVQLDHDWRQGLVSLGRRVGLVDHQSANGAWNSGGYHNANAIADTSFGLLFLKRANVAKDLSKKLELLIDVKGFGSK